MPAIAYVNGRYVPLSQARVSAEDRGFQFADSLYEVIAMLNGRLLDADKHWWRLQRGVAALMIEGAPGPAVLAGIARRLIARARVADGLVYVQITRGAARRDHLFPTRIRPTVVLTLRPYDFRPRLAQLETGVSVATLPDQRWARCDLKTTGLLPAVLAKEEARRAGAFEAMLVREDGHVTEGASTNLWLVDGNRRVVTHPLSARILPGVARDTLIALAREEGITLEERAFTSHEAATAAEMFLTSTTAPILPITRLDDARVANGRPGPVTRRLAALVWGEVARQTGWRHAPSAAAVSGPA